MKRKVWESETGSAGERHRNYCQEGAVEKVVVMVWASGTKEGKRMAETATTNSEVVIKDNSGLPLSFLPKKQTELGAAAPGGE